MQRQIGEIYNCNDTYFTFKYVYRGNIYSNAEYDHCNNFSLVDNFIHFFAWKTVYVNTAAEYEH